jgi:hypothetical protein
MRVGRIRESSRCDPHIGRPVDGSSASRRRAVQLSSGGGSGTADPSCVFCLRLDRARSSRCRTLLPVARPTHLSRRLCRQSTSTATRRGSIRSEQPPQAGTRQAKHFRQIWREAAVAGGDSNDLGAFAALGRANPLLEPPVAGMILRILRRHRGPRRTTAENPQVEIAQLRADRRTLRGASTLDPISLFSSLLILLLRLNRLLWHQNDCKTLFAGRS